MTTLIGWIAVGTGAAMAAAQFRRLAMHSDEGVSAMTWTFLTATGVFWTAYGFAVHSAPILLASAIALVPQVAIVRRLAPLSMTSMVAMVVGVAACAALPAAAWGWSGAVYGVGIAGALSRMPQLVSLTVRRDATGVSTSSWLFSVVGSVLWIAYYAGAHLWAVLVVTAVAGALSLTIAVLSVWRHRLVRAEPVPASAS